MGLLSGYIDTLKGLLATRDACRFNFGGIPDVLKRTSPSFRMFLDSDIGSPIENATKKMWSDSIIGGIRDKLPNNKLSNKLAVGLGSWIGEKANSFMDRVKLFNKYHHGDINIDQYLEIRSTQIQGTFVNVVQKAKKFAWVGRHAICNALEGLGVPQPESTIGTILERTGIRKATKWVGDKVEEAVKSEKNCKLIKAGVATIHEGVNRAISVGKKVIEKVEPIVTTIAEGIGTTVETVVGWAQKGASTVEKGVKTAIELTKKGASVTVEVVKKVWDLITG